MTMSAEPCRVCGRGPAQLFPIRRHVGMIVLQQFVKLQIPLCRDHVQEITKKFTLKTLWQGWWGYISFFVNFFVVFRNLSILAAAKKMPAPAAPAPVVETWVAPEVEQTFD